MRESIGSSSLLNLVIIFVGLVIAVFIGILSYTKAYRVKNRIIEIIEKYGDYNDSVIAEINPDLSVAGYDPERPSKCDNIRGRLISEKYNEENITYNLNHNSFVSSSAYNYCVFEVCEDLDGENRCPQPEQDATGPVGAKHFVVVTFIRFEIPIINDVLTFPVYGETKTLGIDYNY